MKKFLVLLSSVAFITVMSLSVANAQEPEKKCDEKAKTENCSKEKSKDCSKACDKKATEAKKDDVKKEEKKEEKK